MDDLLTYGGIPIAGLIIGVCQILKAAGVNKKLIPPFACLLGMATGFFISEDRIKGILLGLATGLAAVGLYSGTKNVKEYIDN